MPNAKRVLLGCAGTVAFAGFLLVCFVVWVALPSGRPIPLFVENAWKIPLEVHVGEKVLRVPPGSRREATVEPGPVHLAAVNPATGRELESLDVTATAQTRLGRWSEEHVEKRSRFYLYNPGARALFTITEYEYSTSNVPRFGGPRTETIRGQRWVLAERIKFVFKPATATQEILVTRRDTFTTFTARGIDSGPDDYGSEDEGPNGAALHRLDEALRFDPEDRDLWRTRYDRCRRIEDAVDAAVARQEFFRLIDRRLASDPCDQEAWRDVEGLVRYDDYPFPDDAALASLKAAEEERLARRPACGEGERPAGEP